MRGYRSPTPTPRCPLFLAGAAPATALWDWRSAAAANGRRALHVQRDAALAPHVYLCHEWEMGSHPDGPKNVPRGALQTKCIIPVLLSDNCATIHSTAQRRDAGGRRPVTMRSLCDSPPNPPRDAPSPGRSSPPSYFVRHGSLDEPRSSQLSPAADWVVWLFRASVAVALRLGEARRHCASPRGRGLSFVRSGSDLRRCWSSVSTRHPPPSWPVRCGPPVIVPPRPMASAAAHGPGATAPQRCSYPLSHVGAPYRGTWSRRLCTHPRLLTPPAHPFFCPARRRTWW